MMMSGTSGQPWSKESLVINNKRRRLNDWERNFLLSLSNYHHISPKQADKLDMIAKKVGIIWRPRNQREEGTWQYYEQKNPAG